MVNNSTSVSPQSPSPSNPPPDFSTFCPAAESKVSNILSSSPSKQLDSDPLSTWLLKEYFYSYSYITDIVNLSLSTWDFHSILKESIVSTLLKKSILDKDDLSNYRSISTLSRIYKKGQLSLTNPRDACEKFARFT